MRSLHLSIAALALVSSSLAGSLPAADWATAPSYYTHDQSNGQRVSQFAQIGPYYYFQRPDYLKSGYRQYRSTIDLGNSSDNMHVVEQWGAQVTPYEQWRFPTRPYSVPYQQWGPPYGGLSGGGSGGYPYSGSGYGSMGYGGGVNILGGFFPPYGFGGYSGMSFGAAGAAPFVAGAAGAGMGGGGMGGGVGMGGGFPGFFPGNFSPPAVNYAQPWLDGHYPSYDLNDRSQYYQPYTSPPPFSGHFHGGRQGP